MGARILAILLRTNRPEVPWKVLLRNTAAAIVPLGAGIAAGRVGIGLWISVGAIVTMYSDQPGPYRQRLARTTMMLDAALADPGVAPARSRIRALTAQGASSLEQIAEAVERKAPPPPMSPRLRALQRDLVREIGRAHV